jgi:hypothetical protein
MIDTTEAVRLAAEARCEWAGCDDPPCPMHLGQQRTAVAAALPALAEQFAALVEATESPQDGWLYRDSVVRRIREAAEVTG